MAAGTGVRGWLPASPHERRYATITAIDSLGTGSFLTVSVVLFVTVVEVTPTQIGVALGIGGVLSVLTRVPLGRLSDRLGHRRSLVLVHLLRGLAFPGYLLIDGYTEFLVLSVFILVVDGWESPVRKVVLLAFAPLSQRVRIAAYNRSVYNVAFSAGSLLGALALLDSTGRVSLYLMVTANSLSFLFAAVLAYRMPASSTAPASRRPAPVRSRQYAVVGLLLGCLFTCTSVLTIGLPLLVLSHFAEHRWLIGFCLALHTAIAIVLQIRLSRGTSDIRGACRAGVIGGSVLAVACLLFYAGARTSTQLTVGVGLLLLAVAALSIGELLVSAATWGLSVSLRKHDLTAHNQSVWSMYISLPQLLGPFVVVWALHQFGDAGWPALGALILLAALALRPVSLAVDKAITRG
ncbi:MFS transporter [Labedaea rhizosphaerae]|uniref:MFS transporter n=1 Tax=Labedaea rhizosphaerae TaxID=598644 RepID=A0A4R6SFS0_LABRH|nr:MFS transporter [Labedaea rhizosphaerae]TDP97956.1 MFS transporter [Labedaea rhizosphaerae]